MQAQGHASFLASITFWTCFEGKRWRTYSENVAPAIDAASEKASEGGMAAADQAALAGAEAAKKADGYGLDKKTVAKLAKIAASQAGLAAGMPVSAAKTAGMLAANNFEDPTPAPGSAD